MVVTVLYLVHYDSLLQNATDIVTQCDSNFIGKFKKQLLQNVTDFFLQNGTFITNCVATVLNIGVCFMFVLVIFVKLFRVFFFKNTLSLSLSLSLSQTYKHRDRIEKMLKIKT